MVEFFSADMELRVWKGRKQMTIRPMIVHNCSWAYNNKDFQRVNDDGNDACILALNMNSPASNEAGEQKKIQRWPPRPLWAPSRPSARPLRQWPVSIMNVIMTLSFSHMFDQSRPAFASRFITLALASLAASASAAIALWSWTGNRASLLWSGRRSAVNMCTYYMILRCVL